LHRHSFEFTDSVSFHALGSTLTFAACISSAPFPACSCLTFTGIFSAFIPFFDAGKSMLSTVKIFPKTFRDLPRFNCRRPLTLFPQSVNSNVERVDGDILAKVSRELLEINQPFELLGSVYSGRRDTLSTARRRRRSALASQFTILFKVRVSWCVDQWLYREFEPRRRFTSPLIR
jgi:hypothetical protein